MVGGVKDESLRRLGVINLFYKINSTLLGIFNKLPIYEDWKCESLIKYEPPVAAFAIMTASG